MSPPSPCQKQGVYPAIHPLHTNERYMKEREDFQLLRSHKKIGSEPWGLEWRMHAQESQDPTQQKVKEVWKNSISSSLSPCVPFSDMYYKLVSDDSHFIPPSKGVSWRNHLTSDQPPPRTKRMVDGAPWWEDLRTAPSSWQEAGERGQLHTFLPLPLFPAAPLPHGCCQLLLKFGHIS